MMIVLAGECSLWPWACVSTDWITPHCHWIANQTTLTEMVGLDGWLGWLAWMVGLQSLSAVSQIG